jgi:hypothetical protein
MKAMYPQVPLLQNVGLGIALISYNGRVCWGFNGDASLIPDLRSFVRLVERSFGRVAETAGVERSRPGVPSLSEHREKREEELGSGAS